MVGEHVHARKRDQCAQSFEEALRCEDDVGLAVVVGTTELVESASGWGTPSAIYSRQMRPVELIPRGINSPWN